MKFVDMPPHHAVLLVHSERETVGLTLWNELRSLSPAHRLFSQTVLDIETAREVIAWAQSSYNDEKIALISFHIATIPAQNAMLKILEEPRNKVRFILLTSNKENLIMTVLSRVLVVENKKEDVDNKRGVTANEFLKTTPVTRMKLPFIVGLLERVDEEGRKDREAVRAFILQIAELLALSQGRFPARYTEETLQMASYASDSSASGKALLEYLSLLLPQVTV